jgi:hypothetical protein
MKSSGYTASSPILVFPAQLPPQPFFNMDPNRPPFYSPLTNDSNPFPPPPPPSAAGRKRSRRDAALNLEDEYLPVQQPAPENEYEWEYGEGMTLIKPSGSGYMISAGSQTGTWAEEKVKAEEKARAAVAPAPERPIIRSAKSQRLDCTSTPVIPEGVSSNGTLVRPISASSTNGHAEPMVDDFTRHLGIGWSLVSADEDIQAAARGWTRYINNHYPVTDAKIRLQSKGLSSYLVEANEGYFLFGEDLKQGRLVSTGLENTWVNLRGPVPVFEGECVMEAGESPKANGAMTPVSNGSHAHELMMNGVEGGAANDRAVPGQILEVEMDMS